METFLLIFGAILVNNYVLVQSIGICPFLGVSKKTDTALGMGMAVIFVMSLASLFTFSVYTWVLVPLKLEYLRTIAFILIIAALVQIVEMVIKRFSPTLYSALGVYLPLITTNCAVLAVALANVDGSGYNLFQAFLNGMCSGIGFTLAIVLMSGIREKLARCDIPASFKGFPITLITAALMSMAFAVFSGMTF